MPAIFMCAVPVQAGYRIVLRTTRSTIDASLLQCRRATTLAGLALNILGKNGNIATNVTMWQKPFCFGIFCAQSRVEPELTKVFAGLKRPQRKSDFLCGLCSFFACSVSLLLLYNMV